MGGIAVPRTVLVPLRQLRYHLQQFRPDAHLLAFAFG